MRERFYSDPRIGQSKNTALEIVTRNRAHFSREPEGLVFPIWSYLSCYPARFMASPLLGSARMNAAVRGIFRGLATQSENVLWRFGSGRPQLESSLQWLKLRPQITFFMAGAIIAVLLLCFSGVTAAVAAVAAWIALMRHYAQTIGDQQRRITESFSKATEQLASDKLEARLGGIYTLERISKESDDNYWQVMETLTAFVREHSQRTEAERTDRVTQRAYFLWLEAGRPEGSANFFWEKAEFQARLPSTDIAAVLTVLARRSEQGCKRETANDWHLDLHGANLRSANFAKAHLKGADLYGAHLERANLEEAHLEGAFLYGAHLEGAFLDRAHLERANFQEAHLKGAQLYGAHLEGAKLSGAHLEEASLIEAHLEGANLYGAHLKGASLSRAHLEGANLSGAHLEGASLDMAHLEGAVVPQR
jgi:uncharacterized protein YjbI with pentapeptide repeats